MSLEWKQLGKNWWRASYPPLDLYVSQDSVRWHFELSARGFSKNFKRGELPKGEPVEAAKAAAEALLRAWWRELGAALGVPEALLALDFSPTTEAEEAWLAKVTVGNEPTHPETR